MTIALFIIGFVLLMYLLSKRKKLRIVVLIVGLLILAFQIYILNSAETVKEENQIQQQEQIE